MSLSSSPRPIPLALQDEPEPGRAGRVECYLHSDTITQNKGGAMVKVSCDTDFAARTDEFILFARQVAKFAYASSAASWADIVLAYPGMNEELSVLRIVLKERIIVTEISVMKV